MVKIILLLLALVLTLGCVENETDLSRSVNTTNSPPPGISCDTISCNVTFPAVGCANTTISDMPVEVCVDGWTVKLISSAHYTQIKNLTLNNTIPVTFQ